MCNYNVLYFVHQLKLKAVFYSFLFDLQTITICFYFYFIHEHNVYRTFCKFTELFFITEKDLVDTSS